MNRKLIYPLAKLVEVVDSTTVPSRTVGRPNQLVISLWLNQAQPIQTPRHNTAPKLPSI